MSSIGERIRQARLDKGLSQVELAIAANVSQPTVANWERDSHAPRQPVLERLADILESSSHWFLSGKQNNGHTNSVLEYLATPIRHVPIFRWPTSDNIIDGKIQPGPAQDYITVCTGSKKPFALIANDPAMAAHFPIGAAIVFDTDPGELQAGRCYLFSCNGHILLRRWENVPERLEALPGFTTVEAEFTTNRPLPLALARQSIRCH